MNEVSCYGFDPGLRNGALVYATFFLNDTDHRLLDLKVIHSWKTRDDDHLSKQATPVEIARFANDKLLCCMSYPAYICGVEWEPTSVYWRAQKTQVVTTALLIGYLLRGTQVQGLPSAFFSPAQIKKAFGIAPREGKDYQRRSIQMVDHPPLVIDSNTGIPQKDPDVFDGLLIAYLAAVVLREGL